jgi:hypothetical protein
MRCILFLQYLENSREQRSLSNIQHSDSHGFLKIVMWSKFAESFNGQLAHLFVQIKNIHGENSTFFATSINVFFVCHRSTCIRPISVD